MREWKGIQMPEMGGLFTTNSPCLNERHGMGSLAFEPADEVGGVKPPLTMEERVLA
jgi:hypothetical protein